MIAMIFPVEMTKNFTLKFYNLGNELSTIVATDVVDLYSHGEDIKHLEHLTNYKPLEWLAGRPPELVHMLANICQVDINTATVSKLKIVSKIIELIYYCRNSKLVLPNHFLENLLSYSLTNCKTYSNYLGNRSPGGSYSYLISWLNSQASDPTPFPDGLVKAVFD